MSDQRRLRCRLGFHRWTQFRQVDPDVDDPGGNASWLTKCRYCGAERGSGVAFMLGLTGVLAIGAVVVWIAVSPVLGGLLVLGAVTGLGATMRARWYGTYNRRVGFRYRS